MPSFHVVMDCTGRKENYDFTLLKSCANAKYLTLIPPVLNNFDTYGLFFGLVKTVYDLIASNILLIFSLKTLRWVLFAHTLESLTKLRDYAQNDQVQFCLTHVIHPRVQFVGFAFSWSPWLIAFFLTINFTRPMPKWRRVIPAEKLWLK